MAYLPVQIYTKRALLRKIALHGIFVYHSEIRTIKLMTGNKNCEKYSLVVLSIQQSSLSHNLLYNGGFSNFELA